MGDDFFDTDSAALKQEVAPEAPSSGFVQRAIAPTLEKDDFLFEEEQQGSAKEVFTICGGKGDGKTTAALGFPGIVAVLSYDRKSLQPKKYVYKDDQRIKVYDAIKYLDDNPDKFLKSCEKTYRYNLFLLQQIKEKVKPDWLLIDGLEIFAEVGEMVMRQRNNLKAFQGISNQNVWKDRKLVIKSLHHAAMDAASKGVIYTTYTKTEMKVKDGEVIETKEVPKYTGVVLYETDYVLQAEGVYTPKEGKKFFLTVLSSKNNSRLRDGQRLEVTGKTIRLGDQP